MLSTGTWECSGQFCGRNLQLHAKHDPMTSMVNTVMVKLQRDLVIGTPRTAACQSNGSHHIGDQRWL